MSDIERKYYRVEGGKALEAIKTWQEKYNDVLSIWEEFERKYTANGSFCLGRELVGCYFNGPLPNGWRYSESTLNGKPIYVPNSRTKKGKAIKDDMKSLPTMPDGFTFDAILGLGVMQVKHAMSPSGIALVHASFEYLDGQYVLSLPVGAVTDDASGPSSITPPDGCRGLLMSEYWTIKEAAAKKAKEKAA